MNALSEHQNYTISLNHITAIMPLISFMSTHFLINSFVLISDMETTTAIAFIKIASKCFIQINYQQTFKRNIMQRDNNEGYILLTKPDFDFSKVLKTKPKLIAAIHTKDPFESSVLSKLVIPPTISFFSIVLNDESTRIVGKCVQLYKPISKLPLKAFPRMFYDGSDEPNWIWEKSKIDWNSLQRETRDMRGLDINIALASTNDREKTVERFWKGKNSFFWRELQSHLGFRAVVNFKQVASDTVKSMTRVYITLLMSSADGLGVMPALSAERTKYLDFVLTGLDSKYQLLVRTPRYVHSWQSIFKPLSFDSWMCLAVAILLISLTLRIVTYETSVELSSCCLTIFGFVCCQGCPHIPSNISARLVCYTALLFSMVVFQFYTSNFYSLLSTKEVSLPFTSLEQLLAKKTHNLYLHPDTAIYGQIANATDGVYKRLWDEILKKDPFHQLKTETRKRAFERVCKGSGAILGLPYQTVQIPDLMCKVVPVNAGYFPVCVVIVLKKKFPFLTQFKFVHMRLLEGGISHKFGDEELGNDLHRNIKAEVANETVSLEHVAFLFAFISASVLLSWFILALEVIASKTVKRNNIKKKNYGIWSKK